MVPMAANRAINRQCKANWLETNDGIRHRLPGSSIFSRRPFQYPTGWKCVCGELRSECACSKLGRRPGLQCQSETTAFYRYLANRLFESKSLEKYGFDNGRPQCITLLRWVQAVFDEKVSAEVTLGVEHRRSDIDVLDPVLRA